MNVLLAILGNEIHDVYECVERIKISYGIVL